MSQITYLLGAGASANAVPLVLQIPFRLKLFSDYLRANFDTKLVEGYVSDINDLRFELSEYNTIDSYARTLYQNGRDTNNKVRLAKLKSILCGLFMFEQLRKKQELFDRFKHIDDKNNDYSEQNYSKIARTVDPRYKSFFAKVLNGEKLDEQINIISWNYDIQLEIGLENNLGFNYDEVQNACVIYPHPHCEQIDKSYQFYFNRQKGVPQIVKLNGTAGLFLREKGFYHIYLDQKEFIDDRIEDLLNIHKEVTRYLNFNPFLRFAWEQDDHSQKAIEYAKSIIERTETLVVIGYSFPDFNRSVDRSIFQYSNSLREIFLQMPEQDLENVKYNMRSALPRTSKDVQHIKNLTEFFLPNQYIPKY